LNQIVFPAEWQPQSGIMLTWPDENTDWADTLHQVEAVYCQLTEKLSQFQPVLIICRHQLHQLHITELLACTTTVTRNIIFFQTEFNDTWTRDYGPVSVYKNNQPAMLDFQFNGWGNKFSADKDNRVNQHLAGAGLLANMESIPFVLEGGSIDSDGSGCILTTKKCLLNSNRNAHMNQSEIEQTLSQFLGSKKIHWLENGYLAGDDTDSHIDTLARFCNSETIAYMTCQDPDDEHFHELKEMHHELTSLRTLDNKPYNLIPLEIPQTITDDNHQRLPASYANFLISNQAIFMPVYGELQADQHAIIQIQSVFASRKVIPIDCKPLIMQHGSLHCITMQLSGGMLQN